MIKHVITIKIEQNVESRDDIPEIKHVNTIKIEQNAEPRDDIPEYSIPPETAKMDATEHATEQLIFNAWIDAGFEILDPDSFKPNYVAMLQDLSEAARESG